MTDRTRSILMISAFAGLVLIVIISVINVSVKSAENRARNNSTTNAKKLSFKNGNVLPQDTIVYINQRKVVIKSLHNPKSKGTFLLLPGWNFPPEDWCLKTTLCEKVTKLGYSIVMPDMGKSVYQEKIFPETRNDWKKYPTRRWLTDTVIPSLQKDYSLLLSNGNNYIVGLSTGARGVALLLLDMPELFTGAAALSGDYNQSMMTTDNLMKGYYGEYEMFKHRWDNVDNPFYRINEFRTPIYLGHGTADKVVPTDQTIRFHASLLKAHPQMKMKLNLPVAGHDYGYWESEVDNILKFFEITR
jgi:S-formylglutathione hydrolase FrmB